MTHSEILDHLHNKKVVKLTHQCKTENGIWDDERFTIEKVIGGFEQLVVVNQYNQKYTINPKQLDFNSPIIIRKNNL